MGAIGRKCCRQTLWTIYQNPYQLPPARSFRTSTINYNDQQPEPEPEPPQDAHTASDDAYSNIQINPENKTVITAAGELPISPLMDPAFHEARQKFTQTKPRQSEYEFKLTKFQRKLARNPYALALATPVRRCAISNSSLPSFFFERFALLQHPETGKPYFVPQDLDSKVPDKATTVQHEASGAPETGAEPAETGAEPAEAEPAGPTVPIRKTRKDGPSAYVLSRQALLQELQRKGSLYYKDQKRLLRQSDHGQSKLAGVLSAAIWRTDMDAVVLELMRRRIAEALCNFAKKVEEDDRAYIVKLNHWNDVYPLKHKGCLLYLGLPEEAVPEPGPRYIPPRLSAMDMPLKKFQPKLAVHNLVELLGEEHVRRMRDESELWREGSLFLLGRQATTNLQMLLWKLQGFMAWTEEELEKAANSKQRTPKAESRDGPRIRRIPQKDI